MGHSQLIKVKNNGLQDKIYYDCILYQVDLFCSGIKFQNRIRQITSIALKKSKINSQTTLRYKVVREVQLHEQKTRNKPKTLYWTSKYPWKKQELHLANRCKNMRNMKHNTIRIIQYYICIYMMILIDTAVIRMLGWR